MTSKEQLHNAVEHFREWAKRSYPAQRFGEWETNYEDWESLYTASRTLLQSESDSWDSESKKLLLYVIARDNEVGLVTSLLNESQAFALASFSTAEGEPDAKWQLAVRLGELPVRDATEQLLLDFATDSNEYVRRRAMMTLADLGCKSAERLVVAAWNTRDEYQRMASLHVLERLNSPHLNEYLELASADGREYLVKMAKNIRETNR
ncbi:MAG TPA: HEAT repeat domain-containing protein [Terracidiphilus sp.]|nr:HEAT repeat domain-containing protein [Terracidiphilus sp.]